MRPPENQTVLENVEVRIPCEGQAEPANLTVKCYKDGILECPWTGIPSLYHFTVKLAGSA